VSTIANIVVGLIALLHVYIMVLETKMNQNDAFGLSLGSTKRTL
jgi:uncharacterized membrane protein